MNNLRTIIESIIKDVIIENDYEHQKELNKTGFWGKQGAGCIFYAKDTNRYLIAHRSRYVLEPNTWGIKYF